MKYILGPMRLPFLVLTPACVLVGVASAHRAVGHLHFLYVFLAFVGAVSAHISVNAFNEYFDFKSGLDFHTKRTPFSGGSGTLPENPHAAKHAMITAWLSLAITVAVGIYFVALRGALLLPLGIAGLILVYFYTTWLTRSPFLCLIAPGLGFGPLMVMGTNFVLTGRYSLTSLLASLVPFFLVSNLLLLNQFPDVEADKNVGRKHLPISLGVHGSALVFAGFLLLSYLTITLGVFTGVFPRLSLLALLTLPLAVAVSRGAFKYGEHIPRLIPYLGLNVIVVVITPVLVAVGFLLR